MTDTARISLAYRPLRICWVIQDGDLEAFRAAVRLNHTLWGGRFNPIVIAGHPDARPIVEAFRADIVRSIGSSEAVSKFVESYAHLVSPFLPDSIFLGERGNARAQVLDVHNAMLHSADSSDWKTMLEAKPRIYKWTNDDPLADVLLMQLGAYPDSEACPIDYESLFRAALQSTELTVSPSAALPSDLFDHPSIATLTRFRLQRHYSTQVYRDHHGFYVGNASSLDDLVSFWNLRASDISLLFVDQAHIARYELQIPSWNEYTARLVARRRYQEDERCAIWRQCGAADTLQDIDALRAALGQESCIVCSVTEYSWSGLNLKPPMMHLSEVAALGVLVDEGSRPKVSFGLNDRPYASGAQFHHQHLMVSIKIVGLLHEREDFTMHPPYVPELNEFYARSMHFIFNRIRVELERIGLIVEAAETDGFLYGLPTAELFKRIFALAGFSASVSSGGLIARQLLSQVGGLQGARVFKIPGVRRLLKKHGPISTFARGPAQQIIGGRDPDDLAANFDDHKDLYLEPREPGVRLTSAQVFGYLVRKRLFRIGSDLDCPRCQLRNWFPVDDLKQNLICQMCGEQFDATDQLVVGEWAYRRSGVLGAERNAQGAVPVVLTLQQLDTNLRTLNGSCYSVSLDLAPLNGAPGGSCEVDFAWLMPQRFSEIPTVLIGECKDRGRSGHSGDGGTINAQDVANLRAIANAFPKRFKVFIVLAKLCEFTPEEIELARSLNGPHQLRVIMLTHRELEPYHLFERTEKLFQIERFSTAPEDLARATVSIFLDPLPLES